MDAQSIPDMSALGASLPAPQSSTKPQRVLACMLCHQRKVKCDHKFPCANCIRAGAQCVPGTMARRQQRRSPPKKELLERLRNSEDLVRKYEDLLRENNVKFGPDSRIPSAEKPSPHGQGQGSDDSDDGDGQQPESVGPDRSPSATVPSESAYEATNFWDAMRKGFRDPDRDSDDSDDELHEVKHSWFELYEKSDLLLLGLRKTPLDISAIHPEPVHIFRLWQIFLDNVNPLFKVVHTPTMQGRIIEAVSKMTNIDPNLEALMFGIYCMSILSISGEDCQAVFGSSQEDLLTRYQLGCHQALINCRFLRSSDRDCLTALYLYLVSVRPSSDPGSLSSVLGIALRIAQRMGIHTESSNTKHPPLEAEMRRRLWWSFIMFDSRMGEMSDYRSVSLNPTWDCKVPLNVNDGELRPEMKEPPAVQNSNPTEALFAVVRSELGDVLRHSKFHLDFTNPALKPIAREIQLGPISEGGELVTLERMIEDKYLALCDLENPLHFMTVWTARATLSKKSLIEQYSKYSRSNSLDPPLTDTQRDVATFHALRMLECDTKIMKSPLTTGYRWLVHFYFPFPAYVHISRELKRRPIGKQAEHAWKIMSDNYDSRIADYPQDNNPLFMLFTRILLPAWRTRQAALEQSGQPLVTPRIVSCMQHEMARIAQRSQSSAVTSTADPASGWVGGDDFDAFLTTIPTSLLYGMAGEGDQAGTSLGAYSNIFGTVPWGGHGLDQADWSSMDWNLG